MSIKKKYIKKKVDRKIKRLDYLLRGIILGMTFIVLYDSIVHDTPLYYIVFYFTGLIVGRIYRHLLIVEPRGTSDQVTLKANKWDVALTVALILFRFFFGFKLLESIHIVWTSDALYLFFIGIYRSKWKGIVRQIDELVYQWVAKS